MAEVKQIDYQGIFERAAGHPVEQQRVIICGADRPAPIDPDRVFEGEERFASSSRRSELLFVAA